MKRDNFVLVTGGAGFIGSHLCEALIKLKKNVIALDNFNQFYSPKIKRKNIEELLDNPRFVLIEGDILDKELLESIMKRYEIGTIVHLAAWAGVRPSIEKPFIYQKVNIEGTLNLLEVSRRYNIEKFIFGSSSSVYGNNTRLPAKEDDPTMYPISPYAATKKSCELLCYTYHHLYNLNITCLRFFTVYGPRQRPEMAIHKFTRLIYSDREVPMFGDGTSKRDYTYIDDIIDGTIKAIERCAGYNIYNLGRGETVKLIDVIKEIGRVLNKEPKIKQLPEQPGDVSATYADITKARKELGYSPKTSIKEGIEKFISWYIKNREFLEG